MELTLNEALEKAVEAHKAGKIQEADRLYTGILTAQPKHPDANHNMGVLSISVGKLEESLPFFKTALEANSSKGQYWLSFINVLIKLNRMPDAKAAFDRAKNHGANSAAFDQLAQKFNELGFKINETNSMSVKLETLLDKIRDEYPLLFVKTNKNLNYSDIPVRGNSSTRRKKMSIDGYFHEESSLIQYILEIESLVGLIEELDLLKIPPVFAFYTDFSWVIFQSLNDLFSETLGNDFMFLPDFWAWRVDPKKNQAGWAPHRDKVGRSGLFSDGSPKSLTCWVPLTEATPLTGCMYVVPKQYDANYGVECENKYEVLQAACSLQKIRAVPGKPGDIVIWDQTIFHWGAQTSEFAKRPRLSIALEAQSNKIAPFNTPLLNPYGPVEYNLRLRLIGKQILQYKHMYSLSGEQERFAIALLDYE